GPHRARGLGLVMTTTTTVTLAQTLTVRDNDYLPAVAEFCRRTGLGWHEPTPPASAAGTALSVVIPARNNAYSLTPVLTALPAQDPSGTVEVIVIAAAPPDDPPAIASHPPAVDIAYRLNTQVGAAAARNAGTHLAQAEVVVYLDADM